MKYFCSTDLVALNEMNTRGLPRGEGDGTSGWTNIIKHPDRDEWAACIDDKDLPRMAQILGDDAQGAVENLKTEEEMQAEGWFPVEIEEGVG